MDAAAVDRTPEPPPGSPVRVGIRELRQNLSVYLRRVEDGEVFLVTDRGRVVAQLGAAPVGEGILERLIAAGLARPPRTPGGIASLPPPLSMPPGARTLGELLQADRDEEFR